MWDSSSSDSQAVVDHWQCSVGTCYYTLHMLHPYSMLHTLIRSHDVVSCDHAHQSFIMAPQLEQLILLDTTSRGECLITIAQQAISLTD